MGVAPAARSKHQILSLILFDKNESNRCNSFKLIKSSVSCDEEDDFEVSSLVVASPTTQDASFGVEHSDTDSDSDDASEEDSTDGAHEDYEDEADDDATDEGGDSDSSVSSETDEEEEAEEEDGRRCIVVDWNPSIHEEGNRMNEQDELIPCFATKVSGTFSDSSDEDSISAEVVQDVIDKPDASDMVSVYNF